MANAQTVATISDAPPSVFVERASLVGPVRALTKRFLRNNDNQRCIRTEEDIAPDDHERIG